MNHALTILVAIAAALPTTLVVLALWVAHARLVDGDGADSVFLSFVFLFVSLVFFVAVAANAGAVAVGYAAAAIAPALARTTAIVAAGVLVWSGCAWSQRGTGGALLRGPAPVSALPVALFALSDMLILAGGLSLLPHSFTGA